jgi:chromosome segregation ATPase
MADLSDDQNLPSAGDVSVVFDETQLPEDEREDILKEIESRVADIQSSQSLDDQYLRPRRSGVAFPIVINLIAAATIAAGIYFISEYFRVREDSIALESRSYFSAEAQLIEEILRENEQRLAQKDQEIGQIQSQLALLDEEKQNLEANLENQVAERETELRQQLDAELAVERARLADLGQSEETINARLQEIESERQQEFTAQLNSFRAEAQEELDQLAAELSARESQLEQTLQASREERTRIAQEAAAREEELREELGAEIDALEEAGQEAQARISELQALREEEALLSDRVLGSFAVIAEDIQAGLSEEAMGGIDSLERLLRDQTPVDSKAERRRRTELALAGTLRSLVQEVDVLRDNIAVRDLTSTDEEESALEQQRAAELITTAAGVVQLAEDARTTGRINEARSLYQQALSTIPSLDKVYPGLLELEASRRQVVMATALSEAQSLLAAGSSEAAIVTYLQALSDISDSDEDPLRDVAAGIRTATDQNQQDMLDSQEDLADEYRADLTANSRQIADLNQQLLTSRNQVSARDASLTEIQTQLATLRQQLASREENLTGRTGELEAAQERVTELEDRISTLQIDLQTARTRTTSLQDSLTAARARTATLEESEASLLTSESELRADSATLQAQIDTLTTSRSGLETAVEGLQQEVATLEDEVATLRQDLASRPETVPSDVPSSATQDEIDALIARVTDLGATVDQHNATIEQNNATMDENASTIEQLNATITQRESSITGLETQIETVRGDLRAAANERDSAQTELEAAEQQISGLREQIASLRSQRDSVSGESSTLESEVNQLSEEVAILQAYRDRVEALTVRYESGQTTAARLAAAANYETARDRLLAPLLTETANEILPGLVANLERVYDGLISQEAMRTTGEARMEAFDDIAGLTEQVKKNINDPSGSAAVESYLRREPDIETIANEIFEIIELASRDLSAPEVEYRLLGSVSRTTGNLVVVERLVALEPLVGNVVEIRRTPELGQEVPVALGTVIEVTERRVVVSVDQIYQLDSQPEVADIVYLAEE